VNPPATNRGCSFCFWLPEFRHAFISRFLYLRASLHTLLDQQWTLDNWNTASLQSILVPNSSLTVLIILWRSLHNNMP
jgi:hypothetical protein